MVNLQEKYDDEGNGFSVDVDINGAIHVSWFKGYHFQDEIILDMDIINAVAE